MARSGRKQDIRIGGWRGLVGDREGVADKGKNRCRGELERKIWFYIYFSIYIKAGILFPIFLYNMIFQSLQDRPG